MNYNNNYNGDNKKMKNNLSKSNQMNFPTNIKETMNNNKDSFYSSNLNNTMPSDNFDS